MVEVGNLSDRDWCVVDRDTVEVTALGKQLHAFRFYKDCYDYLRILRFQREL